MKKFYGLEVCRFLCSICVLLWHYQHFFAPGVWTEADLPKSRAGFPLYPLFSLPYNNGYFAVQIFWAISGFIFFWKYSDIIHQKQLGFGKYFKLRFSRLYPLHIVTLLLVAILEYLYVRTHGTAFIYGDNTPENFLTQLGMASNWVAGQPDTFNGPIWSVSAEVVAYLVFFATSSLFRASVLGCLLASLSCLALLTVLPGQPAILCLCYFFAGGFVHLCMSRLRRRDEMLVYGAAALLVLAFVAIPHGKGAFQTLTAIAISCIILRVFALIEQVLPYDLSRVGWLGNLTYASYLIHFPLQITLVLIVDALGLGRAVFLSPVMLLAFLSATLAGAVIVYTGFERPAQTLIRTAWRPRSRYAETGA